MLFLSCAPRSKGMFWTCNEECVVKRRHFEEKQAEYRRLNKEYLKGVAEVTKRTRSVVRTAERSTSK